MAEGRMTKGERDDLIRLIKQRERVAKSGAKQRSAELLAQFEQNISALHQFDRNEVWEAATKSVQDAALDANKRIDDECEKLGIPEEFRPLLTLNWLRRGETEWEGRRKELRRVAKAEIEAIEQRTIVQIETSSVNAQTEIFANGLQSEDALDFMKKLGPLENLMPELDVAVVQSKLLEQKRKNPHDYRGPYLVDD